MGLASVRKYLNSFSIKTKVLFLIALCYLAYFIVRYSMHGNEEFLYYAFMLFILYFFLIAYYHELRLTNTLLIGFVLMGLFHFLGGTVYLNGVRLYDIWLFRVNTNIIHYDNFVHSFGVFVLTFLAYNLLRPHFNFRRKVSVFHFALLLFLVVMGIGAVSEIVEFGAVLFMGAESTVGGYYNNAYDLVFNALGSVVACLLIARIEYKKFNLKK